MEEIEGFVTYEQAIKLKELGFDWPCYEFWDNSFCLDSTPVKIRKSKSEPKICVMSECNSMLDKTGCNLITAPSLAKAAKWLREKKNVSVEVHSFSNKVKEDDRFVNKYFWDAGIIVFSKKPFCDFLRGCFESYEAALSAGIDTALNIISNN